MAGWPPGVKASEVYWPTLPVLSTVLGVQVAPVEDRIFQVVVRVVVVADRRLPPGRERQRGVKAHGGLRVRLPDANGSRHCSHEHYGASQARQTTNYPPTRLSCAGLNSLIERIHDARGRALRETDQAAEPRSARWKCQNCGHRLHFTKPGRAVACNHCKVCGSASWIGAN